MTHYQLTAGVHLAPSPAGAYYAVAGEEREPGRDVLLNIMRRHASEPLEIPMLERLTGETGDRALACLNRLQAHGLVQGTVQPLRPPAGPLEEVLQALLETLAPVNGQALLADDQGLVLSHYGFDEEQAEELAGMSASLARLHQRHHRLLGQSLDLPGSAWALVGAGGDSKVGFWPLYIHSYRFVLVMRGVPNLNQPALVSLVWTLVCRYATNDE